MKSYPDIRLTRRDYWDFFWFCISMVAVAALLVVYEAMQS